MKKLLTPEEKIEKKLEKLVGFEFDYEEDLELEAKAYELLKDFCKDINVKIDIDEETLTAYIDIECPKSKRKYTAILALKFKIEAIAEATQLEWEE